MCVVTLVFEARLSQRRRVSVAEVLRSASAFAPSNVEWATADASAGQAGLEEARAATK